MKCLYYFSSAENDNYCCPGQSIPQRQNLGQWKVQDYTFIVVIKMTSSCTPEGSGTHVLGYYFAVRCLCVSISLVH